MNLIFLQLLHCWQYDAPWAIKNNLFAKTTIYPALINYSPKGSLSQYVQHLITFLVSHIYLFILRANNARANFWSNSLRK